MTFKVGRAEIFGSFSAEIAGAFSEFFGDVDTDDQREIVTAAVIAKDIATYSTMVTATDLRKRSQTIVALRTGVVWHPVPSNKFQLNNIIKLNDQLLAGNRKLWRKTDSEVYVTFMPTFPRRTVTTERKKTLKRSREELRIGQLVG